VGSRAGNALQKVFDRAQQGFKYVIANWDQILGKIQAVVAKGKALAPMLVQAAKAWAAISVGRAVVGGGLQAAGAVSGTMGLVGSVMGAGGGAAAGAAGGAAGAAGGAAGGVAAAAMGPIILVIAAIAAAMVVLAGEEIANRPLGRGDDARRRGLWLGRAHQWRAEGSHR
jgi:hypothetical protein